MNLSNIGLLGGFRLVGGFLNNPSLRYASTRPNSDFCPTSISSLLTHNWLLSNSVLKENGHAGAGRSRTFGDILLASINRGLGTILESETVRAVNFYVDPHIALKDPVEYSNGLKRMFRDKSDLLLENICDDLASTLSFQGKHWASFAECVAEASRKYIMD